MDARLSATSVVLVICAWLALWSPPAATGQHSPSGDAAAAPEAPVTLVLSERHFWRKHYTFLPPKFATTQPAATNPTPERKSAVDSLYAADFAAPPPAEWSRADFDDSAWPLRRGREFVTGDARLMTYTTIDATNLHLRGGDPFIEQVGLVCQRGKFRVADRRKIRKLTLSLTYRGGFVAYLNGKEIARDSLPPGKIKPTTTAEDYPLGAWLYAEGTEKGKYLNAFDKQAPWQLRERTFGPAEVPLDALRDGINVLAVELHRSDYHPAIAKVKGRYGWQRSWSTVGLSLLQLSAHAAPDAIEGAPTKSSGPRAWTIDITKAVSDKVWPNIDEALTPIRIVGARNGSFSGQVIVADGKPLLGVSARASGLKHTRGEGTIPASAVEISYAAVNPLWGGGLGFLDAVVPVDMKIDKAGGIGTRFDMLLDAPPENVPAMPVWVTVHVPKGAPAGRYEGDVVIAVKGAEPIRAPIDLYVADWTLPDVKDYGGLINIYQSPETLAAYYKVQPWSDEHWQRIEKSFRLMGRAGNIGLFLPLLAESQRGNAESYVYWIKQDNLPSQPAGGTYKYDFTLFDRYLETALKHHPRDRLWFICLVVWGFEGEPGGRAPVMATLLDPKTGEKSKLKLPRYGTPEAEALLKPLLHACRDRLKAKGLDERILIGMAWDVGPKTATVAMFRRILPQAGWLTESHMRQWAYRYDAKDKKATVPIRYNSVVWGGGIPDPAKKRKYGWRHGRGRLTMNFNRPGVDCLVLIGFPPPWSFRMWMESTLACGLWGRNGNGNVGGDYWKIVNLLNTEGRLPEGGHGGYWNGSGTLYGIYPASNVGRTGVGNNTTDLFAPGPEGPVSTVRFENALEGNQETEARIFIEKALLDEARPLPQGLAQKCQKILDERTNVLRLWRLGAAAIAPYRWQERRRQLFDAAAAVAQALAKMPVPAPAEATGGG